MSEVLDKKLLATIDKLNDQQKKEVLLFVGGFLKEDTKEYDKWQDDTFVAEMDSRYEHYKNGGKMVSADEANERIKKSIA